MTIVQFCQMCRVVFDMHLTFLSCAGGGLSAPRAFRIGCYPVLSPELSRTTRLAYHVRRSRFSTFSHTAEPTCTHNMRLADNQARFDEKR